MMLFHDKKLFKLIQNYLFEKTKQNRKHCLHYHLSIEKLKNKSDGVENKSLQD